MTTIHKSWILIVFWAILAICTTSCKEVNKNGDDLISHFFDSEENGSNHGDIHRKYDCEGLSQARTLYSAVFLNTSPMRPWDSFSDKKFGTGYYAQNSFVVEAKTSFFGQSRAGLFQYDGIKPIQIEVEASIQFGPRSDGKSMGFEFFTEPETFNQSVSMGILYESEKYYLYIFDRYKEELLTKQQLELSNAVGKLLFTVRHSNDITSFFFNHKLVKVLKGHLLPRKSQFQFSATENGRMVISSLKVLSLPETEQSL